MRLVIDANVAFSLFLQPDSEELNCCIRAPTIFLCRGGKGFDFSPSIFSKTAFPTFLGRRLKSFTAVRLIMTL